MSMPPRRTAKVKQTAAVSNTKPVEILFKPKPVYTDEARCKKIEGDVLLQVVFTASGEVKVERVVQGLGYGLDESAETGGTPDSLPSGHARRSAGGFLRRRPHHFELAY